MALQLFPPHHQGTDGLQRVDHPRLRAGTFIAALGIGAALAAAPTAHATTDDPPSASASSDNTSSRGTERRTAPMTARAPAADTADDHTDPSRSGDTDDSPQTQTSRENASRTDDDHDEAGEQPDEDHTTDEDDAENSGDRPEARFSSGPSTATRSGDRDTDAHDKGPHHEDPHDEDVNTKVRLDDEPTESEPAAGSQDQAGTPPGPVVSESPGVTPTAATRQPRQTAHTAAEMTSAPTILAASVPDNTVSTTIVIPPRPPARPTTIWALFSSLSQQFRRIFSNSAPTVGYQAADNRAVENTDHIRGFLDITDPDNDRLALTVTAPNHGQVTVNVDGSFTYDPLDGYTGPDSFIVTASDAADPRFGGLFGFLIRGRELSTTRVVDIVVTADVANRPPVAGAPPFLINGTDSATGEVNGILNVADPDGDRLSYAVSGSATHPLGTVRVDPGTAGWTFTPTAAARRQAAEQPLQATFDLTATDTRGGTVTVAVTVDITGAGNTVATAPSTPTTPNASPSETAITVSWTAPADGGSAITRYSLRYRPLGGAWTFAADAPGSATSATITGLQESTDYEVAVRASNAVGNSAWSSSQLTHTSGEIIDPGPDPGTPPAGNVLWSDRFDSAPTGQLTKVTGDALFGPTAALTNGGTYAHGSIHIDPDGGKLLRHTIPAGQLGAFIVSPQLIRPTDHAVLSYDVRFDENFDWRWGGKIPGLVGVAPGHSIYEPTSGNADRSVGFSTRLMWHGRGDDGTRPFQGKLGPIRAGTDNDLVTYIYAHNPSAGFNGYGWHTSLGSALQRGQWHRITMEVKLNTVGAADGVFKVWVDDDLRFSATNWIYRDRSDVMIEAVLYDIHRGGGTTPPSWVSSRETHIDIRNMTVTEL